jgi:hypothetical protein
MYSDLIRTVLVDQCAFILTVMTKYTIAIYVELNPNGFGSKIQFTLTDRQIYYSCICLYGRLHNYEMRLQLLYLEETERIGDISYVIISRLSFTKLF